jgi:hypothetical protein
MLERLRDRSKQLNIVDRRCRPEKDAVRIQVQPKGSEEYWEAVLKDPRAVSNDALLRQRQLSEIQRHVLRVSSAAR